jgi:hypothetical protein
MMEEAPDLRAYVVAQAVINGLFLAAILWGMI